MNMISGCDVSGKMTFTGGCDMIDGCTTTFEAKIYPTGCCDCEPCACSGHTTINGLSGAVTLTSPDDSVTIEENGQVVELVVSGFEPLVPDYSTVWRSTGRKWVTGQPVYEVVVSGLPPEPGQTVEIIIPTFLNHPYINIIRSNFVINSPDSPGFTLPIPTAGSGVSDGGWGTWTVVMHEDGSSIKAVAAITASSDAPLFNNGTSDPLVVFGILEFVNI